MVFCILLLWQTNRAASGEHQPLEVNPSVLSLLRCYCHALLTSDSSWEGASPTPVLLPNGNVCQAGKCIPFRGIYRDRGSLDVIMAHLEGILKDQGVPLEPDFNSPPCQWPKGTSK